MALIVVLRAVTVFTVITVVVVIVVSSVCTTLHHFVDHFEFNSFRSLVHSFTLGFQCQINKVLVEEKSAQSKTDSTVPV